MHRFPRNIVLSVIKQGAEQIDLSLKLMYGGADDDKMFAMILSMPISITA